MVKDDVQMVEMPSLFAGEGFQQPLSNLGHLYALSNINYDIIKLSNNQNLSVREAAPGKNETDKQE